MLIAPLLSSFSTLSQGDCPLKAITHKCPRVTSAKINSNLLAAFMHTSWNSKSLAADCVFLSLNALSVQLSSASGGNKTQLKVVVNERNILYSNSKVWRQHQAFINNIYHLVLKMSSHLWTFDPTESTNSHHRHTFSGYFNEDSESSIEVFFFSFLPEFCENAGPPLMCGCWEETEGARR